MKRDSVKGPELKEYTLKARHTHQGESLPAGAKIKLTSAQAVFLREKLKTNISAAADQAVAVKEG